MKKILLMLGFIVMSAGFSSVYAGQWFFNVMGGMGFSRIGKTQTISVNSQGIDNTYYRMSYGAPHFSGFLGASYLIPVSSKLHLAMGVSGGGIYYKPADGIEIPASNFSNQKLGYHYDVISWIVTANEYLYWDMTTHWKPFVNVQAGLAFNRVYNYKEFRLRNSGNALPGRPFRNNTNAAFDYGAGIGILYAINDHNAITLSYLFNDAGTGRFNPARNQSTKAALSTGPLYSHNFLLGWRMSI